MERKTKGVYEWERKWGGVKKTPEVIKGQKGLESIRYFNIQINKERYPLLPSLIPWRADVPKFDACAQCEYTVLIGLMAKITTTWIVTEMLHS